MLDRKMSVSDNQPFGYVTRMTAAGPGAIAVLRLWGERALDAANEEFRPRVGKRSLAESTVGELRLGWFGGDEVVAVLIDDSSTGSVEVEIQGHGSEILVDSLIRRLATRGIVPATRDEYLKAHGVKRLERLATAVLGRAETTRAAAVLYRQSQGATRAALEPILEAIDANDIASAIFRIDGLLRTAPFGVRLASGFRVALAGPPNVGKSTLINALAGFERTVVSPIPGTTRDAVDVSIVLDCWPIILTDTAGLRDVTADPLEAAGIRIARDEHRRADLVLRMTEWGHEPITLNVDDHVIDVRTKADLAEQADRTKVEPSAVVVSAKTGEGLEFLIDRVVDRIAPAEIVASNAVVFDEELAQSLNDVRKAVENGDTEAARSILRAWLDE
jgi:tRNA modification GTPase